MVVECRKCGKRVRDYPSCFQPFKWKCVKGGKHDYVRVKMIGSRGLDRYTKELPVHPEQSVVVKRN